MEDVYTIKVKTKPDTRDLYPSERRYSASTVSGLAWVHIALASTSLLLACLALINPNIESNNSNATDVRTENDFNNTATEQVDVEYGYVLIIAPGLITIFGLAAGLASITASVRWYVDRNITWLFATSCCSTLVSLVSFILVAVWFVASSDGDISEFYKDKVPFKDFLVIKTADVVGKNDSHILVAVNATGVSMDHQEPSRLFTNRVLSINILIAAFLELLWSILSVKISFKGMRNAYTEDSGSDRRGNCISVVTTIKGNNTKKLPRNIKLLPKPGIIDYPSKKIKRIFLAQNENGFFLKNQNKKQQHTETSSEFYKERMLNFLNRCASQEGMSNSDMRTPSVQSEALNPIQEVTSVEINQDCIKIDRVTPLSWGDSADHAVYNQNNLNLEKIFSFAKQNGDNETSENKT